MAKSPLVKRIKELEQKKGYTMTPEEQEQSSRIQDCIVRARNQREAPRDEFDGMAYEQVYLANRRAGMSYLQPKLNDDEVRINTGTTEKKIELIQNELLALNLGEEIRAFDKEDNLLRELSVAFTDMVKRTEQIELASDKDIYFFNELLTQPSLFVEELFTEKTLPGRKKSLRSAFRCERRMLQGVQVFLGDVNLPDILFDEQPYLVKYARMNYSEGERIFKILNPSKWGFIKPGTYTSSPNVPTTLYRKGAITGDEIEAYWYMSYPDNEIQIIVNGVPFLDVGSKYTDTFGDLNGYHITMVSLKPYSWDFAYGKPLTQSAKTLQALDNETIRNLIRKFRQVLEPPLGIPAGKMFSRDIWNPGAMVQGARATDFERLIDHQGVTRSEFAMFDLIEKKTNEFIGSSQQDPLEGKSKVTATEITAAQRNAIKMLGLAVLAVMRLKNRLALLRVRNILANYFKPLGKETDPVTKEVRDVFARFTASDVNIDGQTGDRVIQLADRGLTPEEKKDLFRREQELKKKGKNVEFKILNVEAIKNLELYFYASVFSQPKESTELDKLLIQEKINQGMVISQVTGRRMNPSKLIEGYERAWKEKDLFEKEAPQTLGSLTRELENKAGQTAGPKDGRMPLSRLDEMAGKSGEMQRITSLTGGMT